eukprot:COSAG02_NODE_39966_length_410_cov_1.543408_1_plen_106_part_01
MKDRGWPHARSTTRSTDATIAIGRERGRHRPQEGRDKARHRLTGATAERPVSRGGSSSRTRPLPCPHTLLRSPPAGTTRTAVRRAGRWGAATLPHPHQGGAPQRHH